MGGGRRPRPSARRRLPPPGTMLGETLVIPRRQSSLGAGAAASSLPFGLVQDSGTGVYGCSGGLWWALALPCVPVSRRGPRVAAGPPRHRFARRCFLAGPPRRRFARRWFLAFPPRRRFAWRWFLAFPPRRRFAWRSSLAFAPRHRFARRCSLVVAPRHRFARRCSLVVAPRHRLRPARAPLPSGLLQRLDRADPEATERRRHAGEQADRQREGAHGGDQRRP